jgi:hypothetical protein
MTASRPVKTGRLNLSHSSRADLRALQELLLPEVLLSQKSCDHQSSPSQAAKTVATKELRANNVEMTVKLYEWHKTYPPMYVCIQNITKQRAVVSSSPFFLFGRPRVQIPFEIPPTWLSTFPRSSVPTGTREEDFWYLISSIRT